MRTAIVFLMMLIQSLRAQELEFEVSVSNDTLLMGNFLEVRFEIRNGTGQFMAPGFSGWNLVSGPNSASSYSFSNGVAKQSSSFTYYLEAPAEGTFFIEPAILKTRDKDYKTPEMKVVVQANPDGVRQHPKSREEDPIGREKNRPATPPASKKKSIRL